MGLNAADLIAQLQRTAFRDVAGSKVSARIPVSRTLLNDLVAQSLPPTAPIRRIDVVPRPDDCFDAVVTTAWRLVPPLTIGVRIERQPEFPSSPTLVLRWSLAAGLDAIISQFVGALGKWLPPGVRLEGDRVLLDIRTLAAGTAIADALPYASALALHT